MKIENLRRVVTVVLTLAMVFNCSVNGFIVNAKEENQTKSTGWDGKTTEVVYAGENYSAKMVLRDSWDDGYTIDVTIDNISDNDIDSWILEIGFDGSISNIWNAEIKKHKNSRYIIKNVGWNQDIKKNSNVTWGFNGKGSFDGFPEYLEFVEKSDTVNKNDYNIMYKIDSEWNDGFTGSITIENNNDKTIEDWVLEFDYDREINKIWNGDIISHYSNHYVVKNAGYNSNIKPGEKVLIGFKGTDGTINDIPSLYKITSFDASDETDEDNNTTESDSDDISNTGTKTDADENVKESTKTDAEIDIDKDSIEIKVNTSELFYNENTDYYVIDKVMNSLTGSLIGHNNVEALSYEIKDLYDNIVKSGDINVSKEWKIEKFGLVFGLNEVIIEAYLKNGKSITQNVYFYCTCEEMEDNTNIDQIDTDGDGLCNYYETIYGTDNNIKDTDDDGLTDYEECILVGTNPLVTDSDENGISDSDEDFEGDGLPNVIEMQYDTLAFIYDTDGDGASDGDEINLYHTNPLMYDSDNDKLSDYEDILLGFNPQLSDSDGDGIIDGEEKVQQTYEKSIENNNNPGLMKVIVEANVNGLIDNNTTVLDVYNLDILATNTIGLIGVPVDITIDSDFNGARIIMYYNESELGDSSEDNLALAWHDKLNDKLILLNDSFVDKNNNTVSYNTNHFSTYMIVDKTKFNDPRNETNNQNGSIGSRGTNIIFRAPGSDDFVDSPKIGITEKFLETLISNMDNNDKMEMKAYNGSGGIPSNDTEYLTNLSKNIFRSGNEINEYSAISNFVYASMEFDNPKYNNSNIKIFILMCDGKDFVDDDLYDYYVSDVKNQGILTYLINYGNSDSEDMRRIARKAGGYYYKVNTQSVAEVVANEIIKAKQENNEVNQDSNKYKSLPEGFIYVDGTKNKDGSIINEKMNYLPYSDFFYNIKYVNDTPAFILNHSINVKGVARIHNSLKNEYKKLTKDQIKKYNRFSKNTGALIATLGDKNAIDVYNVFISGNGADEIALDSEFTRKTINAEKYINNTFSMENSARENYISNILLAKQAAESVLDEANNDIYFANSKENVLEGSRYYTPTDDIITTISENVDSIALNLSAFGIFNDSTAGLVAHCTYNADTQQYFMECNYYLIDYYDFSFLDELNEQDALGMASGFELIGKWNHGLTWKKGDSKMVLMQYN